MKLEYVNAAAKVQDIQVPSVQVEPLVHLHVYEVDEKIALALLASDPKHWKEVLPKEEKPKSASKSKAKAREALALKEEPEEDLLPSDKWRYPYPPTGDTTAENKYAEDDEDYDEERRYVEPQADEAKDGN